MEFVLGMVVAAAIGAGAWFAGRMTAKPKIPPIIAGMSPVSRPKEKENEEMDRLAAVDIAEGPRAASAAFLILGWAGGTLISETKVMDARSAATAFGHVVAEHNEFWVLLDLVKGKERGWKGDPINRGEH